MISRFFCVAWFGVLVWASPSWGYDASKLLELARLSVVAGVRGEKSPQFESGERARPVFVTIERNHQVIGCRGSLRPRAASLEAEVASSARSAATTDPRYRPLNLADLKKFRVTVTVVSAQIPFDVSQINSLARDDGLVLQSGNRTGIVLPWEGSDPRVRLDWAYQKAGIARGAKCRLFCLKAERFAG